MTSSLPCIAPPPPVSDHLVLKCALTDLRVRGLNHNEMLSLKRQRLSRICNGVNGGSEVRSPSEEADH